MDGMNVGSYYGSSIDISSLPAGMYIINSYDTDGICDREKIILNK